jgi:hypothetical protein
MPVQCMICDGSRVRWADKYPKPRQHGSLVIVCRMKTSRTRYHILSQPWGEHEHVFLPLWPMLVGPVRMLGGWGRTD